MTWLRLEDDMLDHPKWRRAVAIGGDGVMAVWLRLVSWSSRHLTDGVIPGDMVAEVAQVKAGATRSKSLRALEEARLITRGDPEHGSSDTQGDHERVTIVDYLQRNPSRSQVQADRERRSKGQYNRRNTDAEAGLHEGSVRQVSPRVTSSPSHPLPIPFPSHPKDPPIGPPGDPKPPKPERKKPATRLPPDLTPNAGAVTLAAEQGVSLEVELPRFIDHHTAKASLFNDWQAALRTWIRNAARYGPANRVSGINPTQRQADRVALLRRQEAAEEARQNGTR